MTRELPRDFKFCLVSWAKHCYNVKTMEKETVTISKEEYEDLLRDKDMLEALEAGGVDNWEWYGESLIPYWKKWEPDLFED